MRRALWSLIAACHAIFCMEAHAMEVVELERLLSTDKPGLVRFVEIRESPWLSAPVETRGQLRWTTGRLDKQVESPRAETWRILEDRIEWVSGDGSQKRQILLEKAPAVAVFADAIRFALSGDLSSLSQRFLIEVTGNPSGWALTLRPRDAGFTRLVESILMKGAGPRLQELIVVEPRGERTITRLIY